MALVGLALYVVARISRAPLWSPTLSRVSLALWNAAVAAGLVTLSLGVTPGPQEYREWVWPVAVLFAAGLVLNGVNAYMTASTRSIPEFYISNWYILGAFCFLKDTRGLPGAAARDAPAEQGRVIYLREGCGYCHTQFVRDLPLDRPYGRATVAEDYANEEPPLPGTERTGPDLSNVASRQPSDTWHLLHLYNPRAVVPQSVMPGFPWYFEEKAAAGDVVVPVPAQFVSTQGHVVVARQEARALVAYLLSLRQPEVQR